MCTKARIITTDSSPKTENTSNASNNTLHSFLQNLIREKTHEQSTEGNEVQINVVFDDAPGAGLRLFRQESSRISRSNSDPLPFKPSALDVSDHTKRVSRWLSMQPSSSTSRKKQIQSTTMVPLPNRQPSTRRINAAKSA